MTILIEMKKIENLKKIGIGLLVLSLLIALISFNLIFFFINLTLLSLISIIRFRVVRYITIIISVYSIYLVILNFNRNVSLSIIQILFFCSGFSLILYSFYAGKKNEIVQLEMFMKIGVVLLITSLLFSMVTISMVYIILNLLLLSFISIIKFKVIRYITIILSIFSIYCLFTIITHTQFFGPVVPAIIQVLLLNSGLYLMIYSSCPGEKHEIIRKKLLPLLKGICAITVIVILVYSIYLLMSDTDYSAEILLAKNDKEIRMSHCIIKIPLKKYLLIKQKNDNNRICLFCIDEFQPQCFVFNSMLLEKAGTGKFKITDTQKGKTSYQSQNSFMRNVTDLFRVFDISFATVNGMSITTDYSYGHCKDEDIRLDVEKKNVDLSEDKIIWIY